MLEKLTDPEEKRYRLFGHLPHSIIPLLQDTERPSQASVSSSNWSSWADGDCSEIPNRALFSRTLVALWSAGPSSEWYCSSGPPTGWSVAMAAMAARAAMGGEQHWSQLQRENRERTPAA